MDRIEFMPFPRRLKMRKRGAWVRGVILVLLVVMGSGEAHARGEWSGSRSPGLGIGSNPRSYSVRPYVRRNGTYVAPHRRSMPNRTWQDNWSAKPNSNPYTGKRGTRLQPRR
jgi:hypothetical protein